MNVNNVIIFWNVQSFCFKLLETNSKVASLLWDIITTYDYFIGSMFKFVGIDRCSHLLFKVDVQICWDRSIWLDSCVNLFVNVHILVIDLLFTGVLSSLYFRRFSYISWFYIYSVNFCTSMIIVDGWQGFICIQIKVMIIWNIFMWIIKCIIE